MVATNDLVPWQPMDISPDDAAKLLAQASQTTFQWATFLFALRGMTPLMCDRMTEAQIVGLVTGQPPKYPADEPLATKARRKLYAALYENDMPAGDPVIPKENLYGTLRDAGENVKYGSGKFDKITFSTKGTKLFGMIRFHGNHFPILGADGKPATWVVDTRKGNATQGDGAVGIIRPRFDEWGLVGYVDVNLKALSVDTAKELFGVAGLDQGLCSARPACKMPFGQFEMTAFNWVGGVDPKSIRTISLPAAAAKKPGRKPGKAKAKKNGQQDEGELVGAGVGLETGDRGLGTAEGGGSDDTE